MKNLTEAEEKYLKHDWKNDDQWKLYLSNLYPPPPLVNIEKYKKKYFQKNIDKNLDINSNFDKPEEESMSQQAGANYQNTSNINAYNAHNQYTYNGKLNSFMFFYHAFILCLSLVYFTMLSLNIPYYRKLGTFLSISYLFSFMGLMCLDYKSQTQNFSIVHLFSSERGHYTTYSILLFSIRDAPLIYLPVFFTLLINNIMIYKKIRTSMPKKIQENKYINKLVSYLEKNTLNIYMLRSNIEICNLFFIILCLFFKRLSLLNLIIYLHFFKLKYNSADPYFHASFSRNGEAIRQYLSHPKVPKFFLNAFNKISQYFISYLNYRMR